jgi:hypothetical protein
VKEGQLSREDLPELRSFYNTSLDFEGKFKCNLCLSLSEPDISLDICVIPDISGNPEFLLWADLMSKGQLVNDPTYFDLSC